MKTCTKCKKELPLIEFRKDKSKKDGLYSSCSDCYRKRTGARKIGTFPSPNLTHGMTKTAIYKIWRGIQDRIYRKNNSAYKNYGGRGIKCEWEKFEDFYKDMGNTYKKGLSIERIDVNGNYCKNNCKWITLCEQASNKRNTIKLSYKGKYYNIKDISKLTGIKPSTIRARIKLYGYSFEDCINFQLHGKKTEK